MGYSPRDLIGGHASAPSLANRVAEFKREMGSERVEEILQKQDERDRVAEFKREMGSERTEEILQKQDTRDAALVKGTTPSGHQVAQLPSAQGLRPGTLLERMRANLTAPKIASPRLTSLTDVARGIGSAFVGAAEALNPARELIDRVSTPENVAEQEMSTASATASQLQAPTQALSQVAAEQQSMSQEQLEQAAERLAQDPQIQRLVAAGVLDWKDIIQNKEDPELVSPEKLRTAVTRLNAMEQQAQGRYDQAYATYQRDRVRAHNRSIAGTSFTMWQPPQYTKA
jgi:L-lactate utilization protein LutC